MSETQLSGSVLILNLFDISDEIRLQELREMLGIRPPAQEIGFKHPAPEYVRFERPPVVEQLDQTALATGERLEGRIKYYDYGVVCVEFEFAFEGSWETLVNLSCRTASGLEIDRRALEIARAKLKKVRPGLIKPYENWLSEDYYIFHVKEVQGKPTATELLERDGDRIAQVVRGEATPLSEGERREILQSSMSYFPSDLIVVGWNGAFVHDTAAGAETTIQLLEYANSQLLEFRHYDEVLSRQLEGVYDLLQRGTGFLARWRLSRTSERLQGLVLEVTELTERVDNSIKFLSDMFSARLYRMAANKVGVTDYKALVQEKLHTADSLYRFMVEQFNQSRTFALEFIVVVILIIELVMLFKGKG
jgi:hypothetical protein